MRPNELLRRLEHFRINITRQTLYNYTKEGLIPEPYKTGSREVNYPDSAFAEFVASYRLMHGYKLKPAEVRRIRAYALKLTSPDAENREASHRNGKETISHKDRLPHNHYLPVFRSAPEGFDAEMVLGENKSGLRSYTKFLVERWLGEYKFMFLLPWAKVFEPSNLRPEIGLDLEADED